MFSLIETHFVTTLKYTKSKQNVVKVKHRVQTLAGALLIVNEGRKQISMLLLISFISHFPPPKHPPPPPQDVLPWIFFHFRYRLPLAQVHGVLNVHIQSF